MGSEKVRRFVVVSDAVDRCYLAHSAEEAVKLTGIKDFARFFEEKGNGQPIWILPHPDAIAETDPPEGTRRHIHRSILQEIRKDECPHVEIRPVPGRPDWGRCVACGDETFPLTDPAACTEDAPIPMLLWCPECGARHLDEGEFSTHPHHTHACQECGMVWRPAVVCTSGVRFLPGFRNEDAVPADNRERVVLDPVKP